MRSIAALVVVLAAVIRPAVADTASSEMALVAGRYLAKGSHALMESYFRDYPSARFRRVYPHIYEGDSGKQFWYLCGEVNAKNAMGGYTGWDSFLITPEEGGRLAIWSGTDGLGDPGTNVRMQLNLCTLPVDEGGTKNTAYTQHDFGPELSFHPRIAPK